MVKHYVGALYVWDFFIDNLERLKEEQVLIAENPETDCKVYLTEQNFRPLFSVYEGEDSVYTDEAFDEDDCLCIATDIYAEFLISGMVSESEYSKFNMCDNGADDKLGDDEIIYERDDELMCAASDFIRVALSDYDEEDIIDRYGQDFVEEFLVACLEILAQDYKLKVYRPTMFRDENGQDYLDEYPYNYDIDEEDELDEDEEDADISE